jgi:xanthine dehydrogenase large subunit
MGGGFGGKESQSALYACVAAVAAQRLRVPVKIRLDRDDDFMATGKRHCFHYDYEVGYGDDGLIRAAKIEMTARAGFSADLSGRCAQRAVCHFDNTYYLPDVDILALAGKTNTQSNTGVSRLRRTAGRDRDRIHPRQQSRGSSASIRSMCRKANFYGTRIAMSTPYGMVVEDNIIHELVADLEGWSDYRRRRAEIRSFNATSTVLKKGIALTPVKFGISFNVVHYNQAGALVHVYTDGSVLVSHGGTEMGQGLNTKVAQVVAHELGIGLQRVRSTAADTSKVANTSATAASTGERSQRNGGAGRGAADQTATRAVRGGKVWRACRRRHLRGGYGERRGKIDRICGTRCGRPIAPGSSSGPTGSMRHPSCTGTLAP